MELDDAAYPLRARSKECGPEVQRALLLTEARARNNADTSGLQQAHAVQLIGRSTLGLGSLGSLGGQSDRGEQVHGALGRTALDTLHLAEGSVQCVGTLAQALEDAVVLLLVQLVTRLAGPWWVDHELDETLADDGRAQHDGHELVDVGLDLRVEAYKLEVATSVTTLTDHALGDGVEGGELDAIILAGGLLLHLAQDALEAVELAHKDVGLVHLVCHHHEVLSRGEVEHGADVLLREGGAGRVAGVDDDDTANVDAIGLGLLVGGANGVEIGAPVLRLVQVIRYTGSVKN